MVAIRDDYKMPFILSVREQPYGFRIEFGYCFVNILMSKPDCRTIERNVPSGISCLGAGTMAVFKPLRNLAWLARWDTNTKP